MQVLQIAEPPPNHGKINLAIRGWMKKSRKALRKIATAKRTD